MKARRRKRVRVVGVVQRHDTGRPALVYGRRHKDLDHAVMVTQLRLLFLDSPFTPEAKVGRTVADGLMLRGGQTFYVEIDQSQKMTAKQMSLKWRRYGLVDGFILIVCRTEGRLERLRRGADLVKNHLLLTTWERLESRPEPWVDWFGNSVRI